jgi:hypothetical protein
MASLPSSSTQDNDVSTPHPSSYNENLSHTFSSNRRSSGSDILNDIKQLQSQGIHYAADNNLSSQYEFVFNKDVKGYMLVPKEDNSKISEFILAGVFEVDARNFFMTSDGKWNQSNAFGTRFDQVKPACRLLPVQRDKDFSFSADDFPTIITNIHAIENLANPRKTRDTHSIIVEEVGHPPLIRLTHHLFIVRHLSLHSIISFSYHPNLKKKEKNKIEKDDDGITMFLPSSSYTKSLSLEYTIHDWPVSEANEVHLDAIKASHDVQQLPTYDVKNNLIHPSDYEEKIAGAIARVCFSIIHFNIKQRHIFNAIVKDITILRPPTTISPTTLKHILHPKKKQKIM